MNWIKQEWQETKALLRGIPPLVLVFFVLSLVLMNVLANKAIDLNLSWLALDTGIVISWLAFLSMDITAKHYGAKATIKLSIIAILINLIIALVFMLVASIPGTWGESYIEGSEQVINTALNNTIAGTWYVLLGSTIAFAASSIVNALLNVLIGKTINKKHKSKVGTFLEYAARSYGSTIAAQFIDNLIFALLVSHVFFGWTLLQCFMCALTGAVVELIFEIVFSPLGYAVSRRWTRHGVGAEYFKLVKEHQQAREDRKYKKLSQDMYDYTATDIITVRVQKQTDADEKEPAQTTNQPKAKSTRNKAKQTRNKEKQGD